MRNALAKELGDEKSVALEWATLAALRQAKWDVKRAHDKVITLSNFIDAHPEMFKDLHPEEFSELMKIGN